MSYPGNELLITGGFLVPEDTVGVIKTGLSEVSGRRGVSLSMMNEPLSAGLVYGMSAEQFGVLIPPGMDKYDVAYEQGKMAGRLLRAGGAVVSMQFDAGYTSPPILVPSRGVKACHEAQDALIGTSRSFRLDVNTSEIAANLYGLEVLRRIEEVEVVGGECPKDIEELRSARAKIASRCVRSGGALATWQVVQ